MTYIKNISDNTQTVECYVRGKLIRNHKMKPGSICKCVKSHAEYLIRVNRLSFEIVDKPVKWFKSQIFYIVMGAILGTIGTLIAQLLINKFIQ